MGLGRLPTILSFWPESQFPPELIEQLKETYEGYSMLHMKHRWTTAQNLRRALAKTCALVLIINHDVPDDVVAELLSGREYRPAAVLRLVTEKIFPGSPQRHMQLKTIKVVDGRLSVQPFGIRREAGAFG